MVKCNQLADYGRVLLDYVEMGYIPYVNGGATLNGMDCQGLCEYLLAQSGVPLSECDLAGSNAHWRSCIWRGTPEECQEEFGQIPLGAFVFIVGDESGAPAKYHGDGLGDASHMGIFLGDCVIHASASRGCVCRSEFKGKTVKNGGWNAIGLCKWVDYEADVDAGDKSEQTVDNGKEVEDDGYSTLTAGTPPKSAGGYAKVITPNGGQVKLRKTYVKNSPNYGVYWLVNTGAIVKIEKDKGDWSLITAICSDGARRRAYMMNEYLERG